MASLELAGPAGLPGLIERLFPGWRLEQVAPIGPDSGESAATRKATGYGRPVRFTLRGPGGEERTLVWRTMSADRFGHDRRSDRAQEVLLAFDTFGAIPGHVAAIDAGALLPDGALVSLRQAGEFYLVTTWAPGRPYADDLRRIAREGLGPGDLERCDALVGALLELHTAAAAPPVAYQRAIRDLVGHGEGIMGVIDGYPAGVAAAPPERLAAIERRCVDWRWRLRDRTDRLVRVHGDFHPFNVLFDDAGELALLDASRGCVGDRADDVSCMAVNYVFFALERPEGWRDGLGVLWRRFWSGYLAATGDRDLCAAVPPYLAWRGLVLCNPAFYPSLPAGARDLLLGLVERALDGTRFDPESAERLFP